MDISTAVSSLAAAQGLLSALISERDTRVTDAARTDLTEKILIAQTQLAQLQTVLIEQNATIADLTQRLRELETARLERERYFLDHLVPGLPYKALRLKPRELLKDRVDEIDHFVCQPCMDMGVKAVLPVGRNGTRCPVCGVSYEFVPKVRRASVRSSVVR